MTSEDEYVVEGLHFKLHERKLALAYAKSVANEQRRQIAVSLRQQRDIVETLVTFDQETLI